MSGAILIVDDSLTVREDLVEAFAADGWQTIGCESAAQARKAFAEQNVSLVILDVLLPDGDGIELLREFRSQPDKAAVPILMLSSEAEVRDRIRGLKTGADDYVGKPYDREYLVARARQLLARSEDVSAQDRHTVLVIEDSITFREELCEAVRNYGFNVVQASSGEEGLRCAATHRPAVVIVDGVLPGIDGPTVIRKIRLDAALRHTPCILLTDSEDLNAEIGALEAGADAFARKQEELDVILARVVALVRTASAPVRVETASLLEPKRILAVDDSVTYLDELGVILRGEGYDVICARSGEEAIEMLAVQPVDCILLDRVMPGLGGPETCRRIKASPGARDIPLIMLTSSESREAMIEGLSAGADDYVVKGNETEVLRARVRVQLRRKQFQDETRRARMELMSKELEAAEVRAAKALAATRAQLVEQLERKNEELEAFSYSISHDLRAPLRVIGGYSEMLLADYAAALPQDAQQMLQRVQTGVQKMSRLIDDLLTFSRFSTQPLERVPLDMHALVEEVVAELRAAHLADHAQIIVHDVPACEGDAMLLKQVLTNLLSNALKFTRNRKDARVEISGSVEGKELVYAVRDNGAGFDMAFASRLFGVFQRLHSSEQFEGTGIGLSIVARIVQRHGGRAWAQGQPGAGAVMRFSLPRRAGASYSRAGASENHPAVP